MHTPTKHTLLIAEDNMAELQLLYLAMEESGLEPLLSIDVAHDGEEAISALTNPLEKQYNLILLDLNMPRVPGKGVLEYLRKHITAYRPIVIILSNSNRVDDIRECHELGSDGYLQKPHQYEELVVFFQVIRKSIEHTQSICIDYIRASQTLLAHQ